MDLRAQEPVIVQFDRQKHSLLSIGGEDIIIKVWTITRVRKDSRRTEMCAFCMKRLLFCSFIHVIHLSFQTEYFFSIQPLPDSTFPSVQPTYSQRRNRLAHHPESAQPIHHGIHKRRFTLQHLHHLRNLLSPEVDRYAAGTGT